MAKKLSSNVNVDGEWYGPSYPDVKVNDRVAKAIGNPNAWTGGDSADDETGEVKQPPRKGPGSGPDAWKKFAAANGVDGDFDSKDALLAELEARGVIDKE